MSTHEFPAAIIGKREITAADLWAKLAWDIDAWVFVYGAQMGEPDFAYCEAAPAVLRGLHRSYCVYKRPVRCDYRKPGLALGLDRGGVCKGIAYRVPAIDAPEVLASLWSRELRNPAYRLMELDIELPWGRGRALVPTVDRAHGDYAGALDAAATARILYESARVGLRPSLDRTIETLERLGTIDPSVQRVEQAVKALTAPLSRAA